MKLVKLLFLNVGIIVLNIVVFSQGLLGIHIGKNLFSTIIGVTVIVASVIAFIWGNISILFSKKRTPVITNGKKNKNDNSESTKALAENISGLSKQWNKKTFRENINNTMQQYGKMKERNKALDTVLLQHFQPTEMSYTRFRNIIDSVNELFNGNVEKIVNRIEVFDESDYRVIIYKIKNGGDNLPEQEKQVLYDKLNIYLEHINYVKELVEANETIVLKMDKLLLELSKLSAVDESDIENMSAIQDINSLIDQTKFYKQN